MNVKELEEVLGKLKTVNDELERVQTSLIESLDEKVSLLELIQNRLHRRDEIILEKAVYRVRLRRSTDF